MKPVGYFIHHQGRGHAERAKALIDALPATRPVAVFCASREILTAFEPRAQTVLLPSLFEAPAGLDDCHARDAIATPDTLHCAPLGWPTIRAAMGKLTDWFVHADPAAMIVDVSAEVAQLCRICSVPHIKIVQHGDRTDPGHRAAYHGAAGLLAPFHADLAQPDWDARMRDRLFYAPHLSVPGNLPSRAQARAALGIPKDQTVIVVASGAGGGNAGTAALGVGARALPEATWRVIGPVDAEWHATLPANLEILGWVDNAPAQIAAADLVISHAGNTLCHQVLAVGVPWLVIPQWRYFDEQHAKAAALDRTGAATWCDRLPSTVQGWRDILERTRAAHNTVAQRRLLEGPGARTAAAWIEELCDALWPTTSTRARLGTQNHHYTPIPEPANCQGPAPLSPNPNPIAAGDTPNA